ncbi:putative membrane protein DUF2306 [Murinocardiopsis flavida]|uniref:Putative membrane protein DUF2306 n=1 Tax=Murinocardiopsis flavida TaxID=645275 RepID=A0A2P8D2H9_9ACTN|nr:DUF2306 domain-containing protein [Murinocardiopsis flavida]PSK91376.1 putative membrane protein DUF2306 [Murinocardiopsis flavida]
MPRGPAAARRGEWWIPVGLIALSLIPVLAGALRLGELAGGAVGPGDQRFADDPAPVVAHIIGATVFCLVGAFQFVPSLRARHRAWHRRAGRVLVASGLLAALTGMWLGVGADLPPTDNGLLMVFRLAFGGLMAVGLVLAFLAARRRDIRVHRRWMLRSYALGQAAGTQAFVLAAVAALPGEVSPYQRALGMGASWGVNLAVAEWIARR